MKNIVYINPKRIFEVSFSNGDKITVHAADNKTAKIIAIVKMKTKPDLEIRSVKEIKIDRNI